MKEIVLIGSGNMAIAYCEALKFLNVSFTVVGNSKGKAKEFTDKTGKECISGGIEKYLERIQKFQFILVNNKNVTCNLSLETFLSLHSLLEITLESAQWDVQLLEEWKVSNNRISMN